MLPIASDRGLLKKDVPIDVTFFHQAGEDVTPPDVVAFLGLGNEVAASARAARRFSALGLGNIAVVSALPYWKMSPNPDALKELAVQAPGAVMRAVTEMHGSEPPVVHAIAESQQGPSLAWAAAEDPGSFTGRLALLRSLGIQNGMKVLPFLWGMARTGCQADQLRNPGVLKIAGRGAYRLGCDLVMDKRAGLDFALSATIGDALGKIVAHKGEENLAVVAADSDRLFSAAAQRTMLTAHDLQDIFFVIRGSHTPPAVKPGAAQFMPVAAWCRTGEFPAGSLVLHNGQ